MDSVISWQVGKSSNFTSTSDTIAAVPTHDSRVRHRNLQLPSVSKVHFYFISLSFHQQRSPSKSRHPQWPTPPSVSLHPQSFHPPKLTGKSTTTPPESKKTTANVADHHAVIAIATVTVTDHEEKTQASNGKRSAGTMIEVTRIVIAT